MANTMLDAIDAGHGYNTADKRTTPMTVDIEFTGDGAVDVKKGDRIREHVANVGVAMLLEAELIRCGFQIYRSAYNDSNAFDDEDIALETRQKNIKLKKADYSISVHFNAFGDGNTFNDANGISTYIHSINERVKDSNKLAELVQKELSVDNPQTNRGVQKGSFAMVNCIAMGTKASILVELACMKNEFEAVNYMGYWKYWKACAVRICKGFCNYTGVTYVEEKKVLYTVQAGAFKYEANAIAMQKLIQKEGFKDAYVKKDTINGAAIFRVQIGVYAVKKNAENVVKKLTALNIAAFYKQL